MKFKVGDRVRAIGKVDGCDLTGKTGRVIDGKYLSWDIGVQFDESFSFGPSCQYKGKYGYCRWGMNSEFELISNNKIVITTNGTETLARLYDGDKVVKTATSKCNPEDTFDFKVGAKLAYDRLMGEEEKKEELLYNGKVVCVGNKHNEHIYTIGKIYQFKDGFLTGDTCNKYPMNRPIHSFEEWEKWTGAKFIEVKE